MSKHIKINQLNIPENESNKRKIAIRQGVIQISAMFLFFVVVFFVVVFCFFVCVSFFFFFKYTEGKMNALGATKRQQSI